MDWFLILGGPMGHPSGRLPFGRGQTLTVGRKGDIRLASEGVSRFHVELHHDVAEGPYVRDLNSRKGTTLNGERLTQNEKYALHLDDEIEVVRCRIYASCTAPVDPAWLSWKDGIVVKMARVIQQERAFADLPILADALEEAGCVDANILHSCRQRNERAPRSWVVDLLVGAQRNNVERA